MRRLLRRAVGFGQFGALLRPGGASCGKVLKALVHVDLELAHLVFEPFDLKLQLLDLAVQRTDLVFESVHAQHGGGVAAALLVTPVLDIGGRAVISLRQRQRAAAG